MLRVKPLATRDMDPAVRSWGKLAEVYGYVPEVLAGMTWYQGLKDGRSGRVEPPRLWELMRLKVGIDTGCIICRRSRRCDVEGNQIVPEDDVMKVADFENADFTEREKVCLRLVDRLAHDHFAIDDAFFEELRNHFSDEQIVELALSATFTLGLAKLNAVFGVE
jgi:alkylhydroperoxidase family enzyme